MNWNWLKFDWNWIKFIQILTNIDQNWSKLILKNLINWPKLTGISYVRMKKWSKLTKIHSNWSKWIEIGSNWCKYWPKLTNLSRSKLIEIKLRNLIPELLFNYELHFFSDRMFCSYWIIEVSHKLAGDIIEQERQLETINDAHRRPPTLSPTECNPPSQRKNHSLLSFFFLFVPTCSG